MNSKVITLRDLERQVQTAQSPKPWEEQQKPQSLLAILKKQSAEDRISVLLCCLIFIFGAALAVTQIGIWQGW